MIILNKLSAIIFFKGKASFANNKHSISAVWLHPGIVRSIVQRQWVACGSSYVLIYDLKYTENYCFSSA